MLRNNAQTFPTFTPHRSSVAVLSQNSYDTYDYSYDAPKYFWRIGTSGATLVWDALNAPQTPAANLGAFVKRNFLCSRTRCGYGEMCLPTLDFNSEQLSGSPD